METRFSLSVRRRKLNARPERQDDELDKLNAKGKDNIESWKWCLSAL